MSITGMQNDEDEIGWCIFGYYLDKSQYDINNDVIEKDFRSGDGCNW